MNLSGKIGKEKSVDTDRLSNVDILRAFAILGVILVHTTLVFNPNIKLVGLGQYGVQLFFLISGFILAYGSNKPTFITSTFYIKRFFRLAPLFYLVLFSCVLLGFNEMGGGINVSNLFSHVTFIHGLFPCYSRSIFSVMWSLTPEILFYLVFPLINRHHKNLFLYFIFSLLLGIIFRYFIWMSSFNMLCEPNFEHMHFLSNFYLFLFGMMTYYFREFFNTKIWKVTGIISMCYFVLDSFGLGSHSVNEFLSYFFESHYSFLVMASFPLLISQDWVKVTSKILREFMIKLGRVSYSVFFVHYVIVIILSRYIKIDRLVYSMMPDAFPMFIKSYLTFGFIFVIILMLSFVLSLFSFSSIEMNGIKLGSYLYRNLRLRE